MKRIMKYDILGIKDGKFEIKSNRGTTSLKPEQELLDFIINNNNKTYLYQGKYLIVEDYDRMISNFKLLMPTLGPVAVAD